MSLQICLENMTEYEVPKMSAESQKSSDFWFKLCGHCQTHWPTHHFNFCPQSIQCFHEGLLLMFDPQEAIKVSSNSSLQWNQIKLFEIGELFLLARDRL